MRRIGAGFACASIWSIKSTAFRVNPSYRRQVSPRDAVGRMIACYMSSSPSQPDGQSLLQKVLEKAEERALDDFIANEAPSWMQDLDVDSMPFHCTACGRCCQTKGNVYMSPDEIREAASLLQMLTLDFVNGYASHLLGSSKTYDETSSWIRLREKGDSCVFLGDDGKLCTIYEARPVQCRTYPFWPNIMESQQTWNMECRRMDDDDESLLPAWTPSGGGCEGMQQIGSPPVDDAVPLREAYRSLYEYTNSDMKFPKGTEQPFFRKGRNKKKSN